MKDSKKHSNGIKIIGKSWGDEKTNANPEVFMITPYLKLTTDDLYAEGVSQLPICSL